jgi:hypothetical protein
MKTTIDMARESWLDTYGLGKDHFSFVEALKRFEALVRADERDRAMRENAYVQAEREACADVVESTPWSDWFRTDCAAAIRNRGNT